MERVPERPAEPQEVEQIEPICPACGKSCDTFYLDNDGDICGCENCRTAVDAWEVANDPA